jgi:hypothetical protein
MGRRIFDYLSAKAQAQVRAQLAEETGTLCREEPLPAKKAKRIRQDEKPLMNGLEQAWFDILNVQFPNYPRPRPQSKRYKIANGGWYQPDITATEWPCPNPPARETAWECKGDKKMKGVSKGILTLKTAAHEWPEVRFVLVWKDQHGQWCEQEVLP